MQVLLRVCTQGYVSLYVASSLTMCACVIFFVAEMRILQHIWLVPCSWRDAAFAAMVTYQTVNFSFCPESYVRPDLELFVFPTLVYEGGFRASERPTLMGPISHSVHYWLSREWSCSSSLQQWCERPYCSCLQANSITLFLCCIFMLVGILLGPS
jgi:hypothetical protein